MCVETSARIGGRTHEKYIEVKAHLTHICPQFPGTRNPAKEHTPADYLTSQKTATKIPLLPQNAQISTFVPFSSIASSYHPTLSTSSSHTSFYQPLLLLPQQLLSHLSLSLFTSQSVLPSHNPGMESAGLPNPGVPGQSKYKYTFLYYTQKLTNSIYLVIGVMLLYQSLPQVFNLTRSLPPLGVYLHEGGCNFQVGINIVSWFFFITPCTLLPTLPYTDTDNSLCPRIRSSRVQETLSKNQTLHRRSDHKPHRRRYLAPSADLTLTEIS